MYVAGPKSPTTKFIKIGLFGKFLITSSATNEFNVDNNTKNIGPKNIIAT